MKKKILLEDLHAVNSASDLLSLVYKTTNIEDIELPINMDLIASSIDKVEISDDVDFDHLDKAGLIKVNRDDAKRVKYISVWINPLEPETRQRFAKAHELGHLIHDISPSLNDYNKDELFIDVLYRQDGAKSFIETRANRFAAQLLMPTPLVKLEIRKLIKHISSENQTITKADVVTRLSGVFNTSSDAMKYRLKDLRII